MHSCAAATPSGDWVELASHEENDRSMMVERKIQVGEGKCQPPFVIVMVPEQFGDPSIDPVHFGEPFGECRHVLSSINDANAP